MSEQKEATFESVGVCFIDSSGKSLRFDIHDSDRVFMDIYYLSLKDLDDVLKGRKKTATLVKRKGECPEV